MAESEKYQVGWKRLIPIPGYHHVLMILLVIATVLLSILIAGCTTSNILPSIYILSISYLSTPTPTTPSTIQLNPNISSTFSTLASTHSALEVRVSYLGICISQVASEWVCASNGQALVNLIRMYDGSNSEEHDPLNLIWIAGKFKDGMLFSGLLITAIALALITFLLLATFPNWHEEEDHEEEDHEEEDHEEGDDSEPKVKPFPSRPVSVVAFNALVIACMFTFIAVLLQHVASATGSTMVESLSYSTVRGKVGTKSMVMGWIGLLIFVLVAWGLGLVILSIRVLARRFAEADGGSEEGDGEGEED